MALPKSAGRNFFLLAETYKDHPIEFPLLKPITLAQWGLESGWGKTGLAQRHMNYAGMKWGGGPVDVRYGSPCYYADRQRYVSFTNHDFFIDCYWERLKQVPIYSGWRAAAEQGPLSFLNHITPPWLSGRKPDGKLTAAERGYVQDILSIAADRTDEIFFPAAP